MSDNDLTPSRDERYVLPALRVPQAIDGEPHEALGTALYEYENLLAELIGYAEKLENLTRSVMMSEALTLPDSLRVVEDADTYAQGTYELHAVARANQALGMAQSLVAQAKAELEKPIAESRRML
jgi:hypothetical protein